jgi:integrase
MPPHALQVVIAATLTGMRRSELARLKTTEMDLVGREITITKSKSRKVRRVPINDALRVVLEAAMSQSPKGQEHVFISERGEPFQPDSITRAFVRACDKAGITDLRLHDLPSPLRDDDAPRWR